MSDAPCRRDVGCIPKYVPALALAGTKKWWSRKVLEKFGVTHLALLYGKIGQIFEEMAAGVNDTRKMLSAYVNEHPEFHEVGSRMLAAWNKGVSDTLSG